MRVRTCSSRLWEGHTGSREGWFGCLLKRQGFEDMTGVCEWCEARFRWRVRASGFIRRQVACPSTALQIDCCCSEQACCCRPWF